MGNPNSRGSEAQRQKGREAPAGDGPSPVTLSGVAGGDKRGASRRSRQGRTDLVGGNRTVKLLKLTPYELASIAREERRGTRQFAIAAFCFGLFVDTVLLLLLGQIDDGQIKGFAYAIATFSICLALYFANEGRLARAEGTDAVQQIEAQHEFD